MRYWNGYRFWLSWTNLDGVLVGEKMNDLEGVGDNADGEELLAVVAALHHHAKMVSQQVRPRYV